jgi:plasmid stabilization system protein ParE
MEVEFIEPALIELDDAIQYYNLQSSDVSDQFFDEVLSTIDLIIRFPEFWKKNTKYTSKAILKKFSYNLIYTVYNGKIYILSIAHQHREPEYWIDRITWI